MFDTIIQYYPDVIYDVIVDGRYPYYCDFYIPSEDLFIELNAHPSHGSKPISMIPFASPSFLPFSSLSFAISSNTVHILPSPSANEL